MPNAMPVLRSSRPGYRSMREHLVLTKADDTIVFVCYDTDREIFSIFDAGDSPRPRTGEFLEVDGISYEVRRVTWKNTALGLRQYVLVESILKR